MRGLWRTLAYIGENKDGFADQLATKCGTVADPTLLDIARIFRNPADPRVLFLTQQSVVQRLNDIDDFLRQTQDVTLFLYELAEVNRLVSSTANQTPPHKNLKAYWTALGAVGPAHRGSVGFMEAVGALAIDQWWRFQFTTDPTVTLRKWFNMTPAEESDLRNALRGNTAAETAAKAYFDESWVTSCGSLLAPQPNWIHLNA